MPVRYLRDRNSLQITTARSYYHIYPAFLERSGQVQDIVRYAADIDVCRYLQYFHLNAFFQVRAHRRKNFVNSYLLHTGKIPGARRRAVAWDALQLALLVMTIQAPEGTTWRWGSVGPNSAIHGVPMLAAMCIGAESGVR